MASYKSRLNTAWLLRRPTFCIAQLKIEWLLEFQHSLSLLSVLSSHFSYSLPLPSFLILCLLFSLLSASSSPFSYSLPPPPSLLPPTLSFLTSASASSFLTFCLFLLFFPFHYLASSLFSSPFNFFFSFFFFYGCQKFTIWFYWARQVYINLIAHLISFPIKWHLIFDYKFV